MIFRLFRRRADPVDEWPDEYERMRQVRLKNCKPRIVKCTRKGDSDYGLWYCFSRSGGMDMGLFIGITPANAYEKYKKHCDQYKTYF